jgi:hypothetical protein
VKAADSLQGREDEPDRTAGSGEPTRVTLDLSADEALVLIDWLARTSAANRPAPFADPAEQLVLGNLECMLERVVAETFDLDYSALVNAARAALRDHR